MTWTRASSHLMNFPLYQISGTIRGVFTSFAGASSENICLIAPSGEFEKGVRRTGRTCYVSGTDELPPGVGGYDHGRASARIKRHDTVNARPLARRQPTLAAASARGVPST